MSEQLPSKTVSERLATEVLGCFRAFESEVRDALGNTNYTLIYELALKIEAARVTPETCDGLEEAARDRFNEVHRIKPRDLWELQPEATKETYREWVKARGELKASAQCWDCKRTDGGHDLDCRNYRQSENGKSTHE